MSDDDIEFDESTERMAPVFHMPKKLDVDDLPQKLKRAKSAHGLLSQWRKLRDAVWVNRGIPYRKLPEFAYLWGKRLYETSDRAGLVDIWLRHVRDVHEKHLALVDGLPVERRHDRLCELNVLEQVANVCQTFVVQDAWERGQALTVHGWIYGLHDGLMRDLGFTVHQRDDLPSKYAAALEALRS